MRCRKPAQDYNPPHESYRSQLESICRVRPRFFCIALIWLAIAAILAGGTSGAPDGFQGTVARIGPRLRAEMNGVSWHRGCPVPLSRLRLLTVSYHGFDHRSHMGRLIANRSFARPLLGVFRKLYLAGFPIRRMRLVDAYGGSDFRSIEADNTSAFNCRPATGSTRWSQHAYGLAIDVDPIENPYVDSSGQVAHEASLSYVKRTPIRPGMAYPGGVLVRAFRSIGWGWGGYWSGDTDFQHFSANGR